MKIIVITVIVLIFLILITIYLFGKYCHKKRKEYFSADVCPKKTLRSVYYTKNGIKDGVERIFYPTGEINKEKTWVNGVLNGPFVVYFKNGNEYIKGTYSNNNYSGEYTIKDLYGQIIERRMY